MTTTTDEQQPKRTGRRRETGSAVERPVRFVAATSLAALGVVTVAISVWGGLIPFVGPLFGYAATRGGSWHWDAARAVVAVAPGVVGVLSGMLVLMLVRPTRRGVGRPRLSLISLMAMAAGAWFAIGPLAWPVISSAHRYFVVASPFRNLVNQVGYALGPGLVLAACGAFALGWAARHQRPATAEAGGVPGDAATGPTTAAAPPAAPRAAPVTGERPIEPPAAARGEARPVESAGAPVPPVSDGSPIVPAAGGRRDI